MSGDDYPMTEFIDEFVAGISPYEWDFVRQCFGSPDAITVVAVVSTFRATTKYPLPMDHPLNPSSRMSTTGDTRTEK